MSLDDGMSQDTFSQLSLLYWLQRFAAPKPLAAYAKSKWRDTVPDGAFEMASVRSLRVVVPWYRHCGMERTQRWARQADEGSPWTNSKPDGEWLDVPTAQSFAMLLSADPPPTPGGVVASPPLPPKQLLILDLHDDLHEGLDGRPVVEHTLNSTAKWANTQTAYNLLEGRGTYFASMVLHFLQTIYKPQHAHSLATAFVAFPDKGAWKRYHGMVGVTLGLPPERILFLEKSRVGTQVTQSTVLFYIGEDGVQRQREARLPDGCRVLIIDDFIMGGSSLWPTPAVVKQFLSGRATIDCFLSHFICLYQKAKVEWFVAKLYGDEALCDLDHFYTTDSVACSTRWLSELVAAREAKGQPRLVTIVPCAPVIAAWIQTTQDGMLRKQSVQLRAVKLAKLAPLAIAAAVGALVTMVVMRSR